MGSKMPPPHPASSQANTLATGLPGRSWLRKLIAFLLGCAFLLVLSEWLLGVAYRQFIAAQDAEASVRVTGAANEIRVLAIGESTTAVAGNDSGSLLLRETAYPAQLEKILNARQGQRRFVVVNRGGMGGDTDRVLDTLPRYLDNYRPHLILVMMGMKDQVLPAGPDQESTEASRQDIWQGRLRTVRLASMLLDLVRHGSGDLGVGVATSLSDLPPRLKSQFERDLYLRFRYTQVEELDEPTWSRVRVSTELALYHEFTGQLTEAAALSRDIIHRWDVGHNLLAHIYLMQGRSWDAVNVLTKALDRYPNRTGYLQYLSKAYSALGEANLAEQALTTALQRHPDDLLVRNQLANLYLEQGHPEQGIELLRLSASDRRIMVQKQMDHPEFARIGHNALSHTLHTSKITYASLFYSFGQPDKAEKMLKEVLEQRYYYTAVKLLSDIFQERGDHAAEAELKAMSVEQSTRIGEYYEMSKLYLREDRRKDLGDLMAVARDNVPFTATNFQRVYDLAREHDTRLLFVQYPTFPIEVLQGFVPEAAQSDPAVALLDTEQVFLNHPPAETFIDAHYPFAFGHYTKFGSHLLARHVADHVLATYADAVVPSVLPRKEPTE